MKIVHLADLHFHRDHFDEAAASIHAVVADIKANGADLAILAGDTWDGPVQNTAGARFNDFLGLIRELADLAPVAMIYGTPSHDTDGSLEVFEQIHAEHPIVILRPGEKYFLGCNGSIMESDGEGEEFARLLLFGVPEPNKKWLLANGEATGKDATDEAVRAAMGALFLGLGGRRKEHPDLPCILLYHGQVIGAKTGTGYTAGSGIAVTRDHLAMVGADYIAMGDIHLPQQIPGIPAYYPGKIYTGDWKEVGYKPGCNVIKINTGSPDPGLFADGCCDVRIDRLDFPHAQRVKLNLVGGLPLAADYEGRLAWAEITCTREEAADMDAEALTAEILRFGALPGSRVTLNILPTETVRAGEIAEKKTLRDKVTVYAENSSQTASERVLKKADKMERETVGDGATISGAEIRIDRLILRGAIGIWKKSRKDEIDLDLASYGPGVIAMVGGNGAGKTTILENLHPWPQMLTRDGTLKDHFRLKDSNRDLYFTDMRTGWRYRALINIRADIASGAAEYFLYRDQGQGYQPLPGINGRKEPYEEAVKELFGSLEMFLRTAFVTQRPTRSAPDLAEATKGERKALFAELAGIDYLEIYKTHAKTEADNIEDETRDLRAVIDAASDIDLLLSEIEGRIRDAGLRASGAETRAADAEERGKALRTERDNKALVVVEIDKAEDRARAIDREIQALLDEVAKAEAEIEGFQKAAEGRSQAEDELAKIADLEREAAALKDEKAKIDERNRAALVAHQVAVSRIEAQRKDAQTALDGARDRRGQAERDAAVARAKLAAPIQDHCPTCEQLLPEDKRQNLQEERAKLEEAIVSLEAMAIGFKLEEGRVQRVLSSIISPVPAPLEEFPGAARLSGVDEALAWIDADTLRTIIRKADEARVRTDEAEKRIATANDKVSGLKAERAVLESFLANKGAAAREVLAKLDADLEAVRAEYTREKEALAAANASCEAEERAKTQALDRKRARDEAAQNLGTENSELEDWRYLERACGPDGIQALELDALAPGIMAVANRLLEGAYGARYKAEIRTTRIAGKGSKTKQVEDFEIWILDSENGDEQEIATLSGGEAVWIKRALYDAFAIIRAKNCGIRFLTSFQDEADGALDPEARMKYLRMLEAAHKESGRYQTILITHSRELQAMIAESIDVTELEPRKAEGVAA